MNKISLQHNYVQNQDMSSWNDDPFDLKGTFAGVANMKRNKSIEDYAQELVSSYAKFIDGEYDLTINMLPEDEQNELARLYIESTDREVNECVYGDDFSINNPYTCALLAMLKCDCQKTREDFADVTRKNIIIYYMESLQEILDNACDSFLNNIMNEQGYFSHRDLDHGDNLWEKM